MDSETIKRGVLACLLMAMPLYGQQVGQQTTPRTFEVSSVTPSQSGPSTVRRNVGVHVTGSGINGNVSLSNLLHYAYGEAYRFDVQFLGLPDWSTSTRYDVLAKMSDADAEQYAKLDTKTQKAWMQQMLQGLLAERFHLAVHTGTKELAEYDLVVVKGGFKLKPLDEGGTEMAKRPGGAARFTSNGKAEMPDSSLDQLAALLSAFVQDIGRPVANKTGLTGRYDFVLNWSPVHAPSQPGVADESPSIFAALEDLGLKLEPTKGMANVLVIDHVEKPTEN